MYIVRQIYYIMFACMHTHKCQQDLMLPRNKYLSTARNKTTEMSLVHSTVLKEGTPALFETFNKQCDKKAVTCDSRKVPCMHMHATDTTAENLQIWSMPTALFWGVEIYCQHMYNTEKKCCKKMFCFRWCPVHYFLRLAAWDQTVFLRIKRTQIFREEPNLSLSWCRRHVYNQN